MRPINNLYVKLFALIASLLIHLAPLFSMDLKGARSLADLCFSGHCQKCKTYFAYYDFIYNPKEYGAKLAKEKEANTSEKQ